mmetsp:Transcript_46427/g.151042  ORF Transcript_46427/g.151042 Transcript_46427/m.151042 type:complete len:272 (+) Transcript_46427:80-895(+)
MRRLDVKDGLDAVWQPLAEPRRVEHQLIGARRAARRVVSRVLALRLARSHLALLLEHAPGRHSLLWAGTAGHAVRAGRIDAQLPVAHAVSRVGAKDGSGGGNHKAWQTTAHHPQRKAHRRRVRVNAAPGARRMHEEGELAIGEARPHLVPQTVLARERVYDLLRLLNLAGSLKVRSRLELCAGLADAPLPGPSRRVVGGPVYLGACEPVRPRNVDKWLDEAHRDARIISRRSPVAQTPAAVEHSGHLVLVLSRNNRRVVCTRLPMGMQAGC